MQHENTVASLFAVMFCHHVHTLLHVVTTAQEDGCALVDRLGLDVQYAATGACIGMG